MHIHRCEYQCICVRAYRCMLYALGDTLLLSVHSQRTMCADHMCGATVVYTWHSSAAKANACALVGQGTFSASQTTYTRQYSRTVVVPSHAQSQGSVSRSSSDARTRCGRTRNAALAARLAQQTTPRFEGSSTCGDQRNRWQPTVSPEISRRRCGSGGFLS